ncbi:hypothetical protein T9A_00310 [Alcanivorax jadensis T9]|jgi:hypothetical protein|uniref:Uncharacterized protein n=1 Tax=Alcanivorax jadensis T9 TaxID=1177181 RepID=A0ABR4WHP0_9GAMM|nr:hypothetical protein T9A_00310 [Alcanivorax jadensis T9]MBP21108.1 hypothetical protein [Alcanivorax sp.]|tara:strand:- start:615 stop:809 length:195 start_codon:yes stop_codon:yes gene_type:complete
MKLADIRGKPGFTVILPSSAAPQIIQIPFHRSEITAMVLRSTSMPGVGKQGQAQQCEHRITGIA